MHEGLQTAVRYRLWTMDVGRDASTMSQRMTVGVRYHLQGSMKMAMRWGAAWTPTNASSWAVGL